MLRAIVPTPFGIRFVCWKFMIQFFILRLKRRVKTEIPLRSWFFQEPMKIIERTDQLCVNFWLIFGVKNEFENGRERNGQNGGFKDPVWGRLGE